MRSASAAISPPQVASSSEVKRFDGRRPGQPATSGLVGPRVVEYNATTDGHERAPAGPVELAAGLGVIAVDEHHVHLTSQLRSYLMGQGYVPGTLGALEPRRRRARATTRRVAHSVAPHPLGSASGWEPKEIDRCNSPVNL